jgi:hypothetical protein
LDDNSKRILEDDKDAATVMSEDHLPHLKWWEGAERKTKVEGEMLEEQAELEESFATKREKDRALPIMSRPLLPVHISSNNLLYLQ